MAKRKLPNYLKTHRKRASFTQDEVAFLLGANSGTKASRHERNARMPNLETALAYETLFGTPVSELFAGLHQKVEKSTSERAKELAERLRTDDPDRRTVRKFEALRRLTGE